MKYLLSLLLLLLITTAGYTQNIKASVKDLAFMAGTWTLKHQWGDMEEFWGPPMGDNMVSGSPVMKMRHFNPGNIGWEEKDKPLMYKRIALTKTKVVFESTDKNLKLSYERLNSSKMNVVLDEKDKKGVWKKEMFKYTIKP
jgi:hypothetical protein